MEGLNGERDSGWFGSGFMISFNSGDISFNSSEWGRFFNWEWGNGAANQLGNYSWIFLFSMDGLVLLNGIYEEINGENVKIILMILDWKWNTG